jgi:hypothetical protein
MSEVTRILSAIEQGDPHAAEQLLPLVYDELRQLASQKLAQEKPGQTLQATALVHEVYLRLVDVEKVQHWDSTGHFFSAAAEAMRRILIDSARRKQTYKHGGGRKEIDIAEAELEDRTTPQESGLGSDPGVNSPESHDRRLSEEAIRGLRGDQQGPHSSLGSRADPVESLSGRVADFRIFEPGGEC